MPANASPDAMREMVDNARELAKRLQRPEAGSRLRVRFHAFDDEDHLTVLSASIGRALAFALRSDPSSRTRPAFMPIPGGRRGA